MHDFNHVSVRDSAPLEFEASQDSDDDDISMGDARQEDNGLIQEKIEEILTTPSDEFTLFLVENLKAI